MNPNSQEYKIIHFEAGDFKDQNSNTWCNVLFEGFASEPIRWVVKDPSTVSVGQTVYGHVEVKTSQAGKPYNRFYRDQRPDAQHSGAPVPAGQVAQGKYPRNDEHTQESIARSVALKAAVDIASTTSASSLGAELVVDAVLQTAETFLAWLQGNSGSTGAFGAGQPTLSAPATNEVRTPAPAASGYDKFRASGTQIQHRAERQEDEEIKTYLENQYPPDFNEEDIPY